MPKAPVPEPSQTLRRPSNSKSARIDPKTPRSRGELAPPLKINDLGGTITTFKHSLALESMMSSDEKCRMNECNDHLNGKVERVK